MKNIKQSKHKYFKLTGRARNFKNISEFIVIELNKQMEKYDIISFLVIRNKICGYQTDFQNFENLPLKTIFCVKDPVTIATSKLQI